MNSVLLPPNSASPHFYDVHHHYPHHHRPNLQRSASSSPCVPTINTNRDMQRPPLRHRLSNPRTMPIPPGLLDSPYLQSPNSPYRRIDHRIVVVGSSTGGGASAANPGAPSHQPPKCQLNTAQLNLLDTVPMGASQREYEEATATYRQQLSMGTLGMGPPPPASPTSPSIRTRKGSNVGLVELQQAYEDGGSGARSGLHRTPSTGRTRGGPGPTPNRPPYMRESSWYLFLQKDQAAAREQHDGAWYPPPGTTGSTTFSNPPQSRRTSHQQQQPSPQSPTKQRLSASTSVPGQPPTSAAR
ncbi:hypothetical protein FRB93_005568 [Tulasnella sp. JGI-2019a]|nr:hypothetical protein FRB93_005568 [Tulasnella sp. JGI-2019a]